MYDIGACLLSYNQLDSAQVYFNKCLAKNDRFADAWNALAVIATRRKDYTSAQTQIQRAIALENDNYGFRLNLIVIYYLSGQKEKANQELEIIPPGEIPNLQQIKKQFEP